MHICVEAGPGSSWHAALASSNSRAVIQPRRSIISSRSSATCAGGPPKPIVPIRPHSRSDRGQRDPHGGATILPARGAPVRRAGGAARGARRPRPRRPTARSPRACARARWRTSSARSTCSARARRCAPRSSPARRTRWSCSARPAPARPRSPGSPPSTPTPPSRSSRRSTPAAPRCAAVIERARQRPRGRPRDDLLPRRDPPLQQGPAGRAAARGRGGAGDADRRHHREPLLRGQQRAALPRAGLRAALAHRRAGPGAAAARARRRASAPASRRPTTCSSSSPRAPAATRARR